MTLLYRKRVEKGMGGGGSLFAIQGEQVLCASLYPIGIDESRKFGQA